MIQNLKIVHQLMNQEEAFLLIHAQSLFIIRKYKDQLLEKMVEQYMGKIFQILHL